MVHFLNLNYLTLVVKSDLWNSLCLLIYRELGDDVSTVSRFQSLEKIWGPHNICKYKIEVDPWKRNRINKQQEIEE